MSLWIWLSSGFQNWPAGISLGQQEFVEPLDHSRLKHLAGKTLFVSPKHLYRALRHFDSDLHGGGTLSKRRGAVKSAKSGKGICLPRGCHLRRRYLVIQKNDELVFRFVVKHASAWHRDVIRVEKSGKLALELRPHLHMVAPACAPCANAKAGICCAPV